MSTKCTKPEVTLRDWCLGFRKTANGFIVCLEGTPINHPHMDADPTWTSHIVKVNLDKGVIETKNTKYSVCGMPREFYTTRAKDKHGRHMFTDSDGKRVGGKVYNFGSKCWWFNSKYYKSLWVCQVAADLMVLRKKVKLLNS